MYMQTAEKHYAFASDEEEEFRRMPHIAIATILAWCSIESFVNSMLDDFSSIAHHFQLHERALLEEKKVMFEDTGLQAGTFALKGKAYWRTEHKIQFLVSKFGAGVDTSDLNRGQSLWQSFQALKRTRNAIVHPRQNEPSITVDDVETYIDTAKRVIQTVGLEVWNQPIVF